MKISFTLVLDGKDIIEKKYSLALKNDPNFEHNLATVLAGVIGVALSISKEDETRLIVYEAKKIIDQPILEMNIPSQDVVKPDFIDSSSPHLQPKAE